MWVEAKPGTLAHTQSGPLITQVAKSQVSGTKPEVFLSKGTVRKDKRHKNRPCSAEVPNWSVLYKERGCTARGVFTAAPHGSLWPELCPVRSAVAIDSHRSVNPVVNCTCEDLGCTLLMRI